MKTKLQDRAMIPNKKATVLAYSKNKSEKHAEVKVIRIAIKYIVQEQIINLQIQKIQGKVNISIPLKINNKKYHTTIHVNKIKLRFNQLVRQNRILRNIHRMK